MEDTARSNTKLLPCVQLFSFAVICDIFVVVLLLPFVFVAILFLCSKRATHWKKSYTDVAMCQMCWIPSVLDPLVVVKLKGVGASVATETTGRGSTQDQYPIEYTYTCEHSPACLLSSPQGKY